MLRHPGVLSPAERAPIIQQVAEYVASQVQQGNVAVENSQELATYLLEHFAILQPLIDACLKVREQVGNEARIRLGLEKEDYDLSNYAHPVIYVQKENMDRATRKSIRALRENLLQPFIEEGVTFGCRPELT